MLLSTCILLHHHHHLFVQINMDGWITERWTSGGHGTTIIIIIIIIIISLLRTHVRRTCLHSKNITMKHTTRTASSIDIRCPEKAPSKVRRRCFMKTAVGQNAQPECDSLRNSQPMEHMKQWGYAFWPPRWETHVTIASVCISSNTAFKLVAQKSTKMQNQWN